MAVFALIFLGGGFVDIPRSVRSSCFVAELLAFVTLQGATVLPFEPPKRPLSRRTILIELAIVFSIVGALLGYNVTSQRVYVWIFHLSIQVGLFGTLLRGRHNQRNAAL
jgi:hypothetical protein